MEGVDELSKVVIPVHTREELFRSFDSDAAGRDDKVCAGGDGKNIMPQSDSGGPLIDQETGQLIGVASFGVS